ncbi:tricyclene synthase EBOS [Pyrus ussuriensis x Pyrus communis]|uniref:Tricyclene synthase EBOS n=1 Tax=Pyrus ussuriensis x Pyrus communis TaxID=2448454 RepID=A0A5N5GA36_9ROSA|nr:tricyclene synthase EBOS [Pyrus ussuriensis x Pyrus communis]
MNNITHFRTPGTYKPSIWNYDFIQSLKIDHNTLQDKAYKDGWKFLEEKVKHMIDYDDDEINTLTMLEFIDDIQQLGLGYHFEEDITRALDKILNNIDDQRIDQSLHFTALSFRLLRQHGFEVSQNVFSRFTDGNGSFKAWLCKDVKGMLSLYEASYFAFEGESLLDEGLVFSTICLKNLSGANVTKGLAEQVSHALELPLHHRMQRLEARWYIEAYSKRPDANQVLLEIAKRDFNRVQCTLQMDLQEVSRWWADMGLAKKLSFTRDRLMECFFWSVGIVFEPQHSHARKGLAKVAALVTTIDDVYDVYGTLDELELFTSAVERLEIKKTVDIQSFTFEYAFNSELLMAFHCVLLLLRWDIKAVENLPDYMKLCFLALYNTVNKMVYDTLKKQGENAEVERGETANSISCMMRGSLHISEESAHGASATPFTKQFVKAARNLARISQCIYQYGDGHGAPDTRAKNRILSVIIDPI